MKNPILDTDSYKASHFLQYPPGTSHVYSYLESRGGRWDKTVFFGLQIILRDLEKFVVTKEMVDEAQAFFKMHGEPFPYDGWMSVAEKHGGKLPVEIKAVPEGTIVDGKNVLMTIENTDPAAYWLPGWLETRLMRVWYPTTVATLSYQCKRRILDFLFKTSDLDPMNEILFKLHDFGARGVSSSESAAIGGAAHLVNFMGSDTVVALELLRDVYDIAMGGFSIVASEHSTMTSWGGREGEPLAMENMLDKFTAPGAIIACVSDSYSLRNACTNIWGDRLKKKVDKLGELGGRLVPRPDSGNPPDIVLEVVELLAKKFGHSVNKKGYKVLPDHVRVIQGDGITVDSILDILSNLARNGWSADNVSFGMGGGLLQQVNRDTLKFAIKCSEVTVNGSARDVFKQPEDAPDKRSKSGRLKLCKVDGKFFTVSSSADYGEDLRYARTLPDLLVPVFRDGKIMKEWNMTEVRARAQEGITDGLFYSELSKS